MLGHTPRCHVQRNYPRPLSRAAQRGRLARRHRHSRSDQSRLRRCPPPRGPHRERPRRRCSFQNSRLCRRDSLQLKAHRRPYRQIRARTLRHHPRANLQRARRSTSSHLPRRPTLHRRRLRPAEKVRAAFLCASAVSLSFSVSSGFPLRSLCQICGR
jgi:hypothetical protein